MKEPLIITPKQDTDSSRLAAWLGMESEQGGGREVGGEREGRRDRRTRGEGLEDTQETRRIHSGERCLSNCCKSSAGPCKLSDKLRVLKA